MSPDRAGSVILGKQSKFHYWYLYSYLMHTSHHAKATDILCILFYGFIKTVITFGFHDWCLVRHFWINDFCKIQSFFLVKTGFETTLLLIMRKHTHPLKLHWMCWIKWFTIQILKEWDGEQSLSISLSQSTFMPNCGFVIWYANPSGAKARVSIVPSDNNMSLKYVHIGSDKTLSHFVLSGWSKIK